MRGSTHQPSRRGILKGGAALGVGALFLGVGACSSDDSSSGSTLTLPAPSLDALLGNAPLHVAMTQSLFDRKVKFADVVGTDVIRTIQSSAVIGVAGALPAIVAYSKGAKDLRIVSPLFSAVQTTFIAPADSPLESLADLKPGMKIGAAVPASPPTYFAELAVRKAGLETGKDVEVLTLGRAPDAWTAAKNGVVDLAWSNPPFDTGLLASGEAKLVGAGSDLLPNWIDLVLVTTEGKAKSQKDTVEAVRSAIAEAQELITSDADAAAKAWAKSAGLDAAVATKALEAAPANAWRGSITADDLASVVAAAAEMGLVEKGLDVSGLIATGLGGA